MAQNNNLVLNLLITAKDEASALFGKIFRSLNDSTNVIATQVRSAFTGLFGGALDGAAEFEAQLDRVQAKGGYTADTMVDLKKKAEAIGAQFGLSGTEAAQGMESLAAAGLSAVEVAQTLPPVLNLAKAEALSMDDASALLANSLTTVGLGFDQAARLADVLTQAANESTTSASAVGKALETAGGIARASALDLEQTVAALTALAKGGIEGERAGTSLAAILTQLLNPASSASKELNKLGISSRDLGTVISELESRGAGANAAILAFGETAGPGLRALIDQGQGGLNALETAMRGAEGAAGDAATQMSGNLQGALSSLSNAWAAVKTALLEPVLEPLAKAAQDASTALTTTLSDGALKPVQEAIKSFAENAIAAARDFIASFDFKAVIVGLQGFATNATSAFTTIGSVGKTAAEVVAIAWNGITATVKGISAAIVEVTASVVATLANVEEAASKIGLGSAQRAAELRAQALAMQNTAKTLIDGVKQDAQDLGAAYDRLTSGTGAAADAQKGLKNALPVAELQTLNKTLADYQGMAAKANAQAAQARKDFEAGRISAAEYGVKLLAAAEANKELADQTKVAAKATQASAAELAGQLGLLEQTAKADGELADAQAAVRQSALDLIEAEIDLARAKGDTVTVARLQKSLVDEEIQQARDVAAAKEKEASNLQAQLANRLQYRASLEKSNEALEREIALLVARTNAANGDAAVAQKQVETLETTKNKRKEATDETGKNTEATGKNTEATEDNAKASEGAAKKGGDLTKAVASLIEFWRQQTAALSEATRALFEWKAGLSDIDPRLAKDTVGAVSEEAAKAASKIGELTAFIRDMEEQMLYSTNSVGHFMDFISATGAAAEKAYYEQKLAAEALEQQLLKTGETGGRGFSNIDAALGFVNSSLASARDGFWLLNEQDLGQLEQAAEQVNQRLREMQDAARAAKDRLAELNAEILEEQGQDQKAAILRQQLDYQQQLAEIEKQRAEAVGQGNQELIALLNEQEDKLKTLNNLKLENIAQDEQSASVADRATSSVSRLADEAERASRALGGLGNASLEKINRESGQLYNHLKSVSDLL